MSAIYQLEPATHGKVLLTTTHGVAVQVDARLTPG